MKTVKTPEKDSNSTPPQSSGRLGVGCSDLLGYFLAGRNPFEWQPSMCSCRLSSMLLCKGSRMKSNPSLRANLDAGTKSASPAINTILSTCDFRANDATSTAILESTAFCLTSYSKSSSTNESQVTLSCNRFFKTDERIFHPPCWDRYPNLRATLRRARRDLKRADLNLYWSVLEKSIDFLESGRCAFLSKGGQS